jgi:hypothetical protein
MTTDRFAQAVETHEAAARHHAEAAAMWEERGDHELAALELRNAAAERELAAIERERSRLFHERGGSVWKRD